MSRAAAFPDSLVGRQGDAGSEAKSPTDQVPHRIGQGRRPGLHCLGRPSLCRRVWDEGDAGRQEGVQVHIPKCASAATLAARRLISMPVGGGCLEAREGSSLSQLMGPTRSSIYSSLALNASARSKISVAAKCRAYAATYPGVDRTSLPWPCPPASLRTFGKPD